MQLRGLLLVAAAATAITGCGVTQKVTGQASPVVTARVTVHPAPGIAITKADTDATVAVIEKRLHSLGVGNFSLAAGNDITIDFTGSVDVAAVQDTIQANGIVQFVPRGAADTPPPAGSLPAVGPEPLWPGNEIASVRVGKAQDSVPTFDITLTPDGAQVFGAWTTTHVCMIVLVLLDGRVLSALTIARPIQNAEVSISAPPGFPLPIEVVAAILDSGPSTAGWRQP